MSGSPVIRLPAVHGLFYPSDASRLAEKVDALLDAAGPPPPGRPRALLSPHAGYAYSGAIAARSFRCLEATSADTFVLVGPSHVEAFDFTSLFDGDAYRTPLGDVPVDRSTARAIAAAAPSARLSHHGHVLRGSKRGEHGLEVLLPFLQRAVPAASIVPVVMGSQDLPACRELAAAIAAVVDPDRTVVVASSDLSHFHRYDEATRLDAVFCDLLQGMDAVELLRAVGASRCEACGAGPVAATLLASSALGDRSCRVLARANSADAGGDRRSVVGYAAAAFTGGTS